MKRRNLLVAMAAGFAAGCSKLAETQPVAGLLKAAEGWHRGTHRTIAGRQALAREYDKTDISPFFRGNGTQDPGTRLYAGHAATGFVDWRLDVMGLVDNPLSLSLDDIRAMPQRTQITRHDCVEGWSAIGEWSGPQLAHILDLAQVTEDARFIVFHCADKLDGAAYYDSVDMVDAYHPQTIVAHRLNGEPLPVRNGAPLRMRIERQLGYKHAKYLTAIEAVATLERTHGGNGGYWEDRGYQWYAGI